MLLFGTSSSSNLSGQRVTKSLQQNNFNITGGGLNFIL